VLMGKDGAWLDHPKADISSAFDHPAHRDRPQHAGLAAAHKPPPGKGGGVCRAKTFIVLRRITGTGEPQRGNMRLLGSLSSSTIRPRPRAPLLVRPSTILQ